jgi:hypothetical protein
MNYIEQTVIVINEDGIHLHQLPPKLRENQEMILSELAQSPIIQTIISESSQDDGC